VDYCVACHRGVGVRIPKTKPVQYERTNPVGILTWNHTYNNYRPHTGIRGETSTQHTHTLRGKNS